MTADCKDSKRHETGSCERFSDPCWRPNKRSGHRARSSWTHDGGNVAVSRLLVSHGGVYLCPSHDLSPEICRRYNRAC